MTAVDPFRWKDRDIFGFEEYEGPVTALVRAVVWLIELQVRNPGHFYLSLSFPTGGFLRLLDVGIRV